MSERSVPATPETGVGWNGRLLFRHRGAAIQVIRQGPGASGGRRDRQIGRIPRATLEPPPELLAGCSEVEQQEIVEWLEIARQMHRVREKAAAFSLSDSVGAAIRYLRMSTDEGERRMLLKMIEVAALDLRREINATDESPMGGHEKVHPLD